MEPMSSLSLLVEGILFFNQHFLTCLLLLYNTHIKIHDMCNPIVDCTHLSMPSTTK